jgi:predicted alpha/beta superfamily hydrolase
MKKFFFTALVSVVSTAIITFVAVMFIVDSSESPDSFLRTTIHSELLNEEREIIIDLPDSYEKYPEKSYPVIYVIGGNSLSYHTAEVRDLMARIEVIPEIIVVGIPNFNQDTRLRDITPPFLKRDLDESDSLPGEADVYLTFIEEEVIPCIEANYHTSSFRMLAGHSREGLCVAYSLIEKPALFNARFALSPALWREDSAIVPKLKEFLDSNPTLETSLYMSLGDLENDKMTKAYKLAVEVLEKSTNPNLRWQASYTAGADHSNNYMLSIPVALRWLYQGWGSESK